MKFRTPSSYARLVPRRSFVYPSCHNRIWSASRANYLVQILRFRRDCPELTISAGGILPRMQTKRGPAHASVGILPTEAMGVKFAVLVRSSGSLAFGTIDKLGGLDRC